MNDEILNIGKLTFKIASHEDNSKIIKFLKMCPSHGHMQIALDRGPHFFEAMEVEGLINLPVICIDSTTSQIVSMGSISEKKCFLNNCEHPIGYLSSLRSLPEVQRSTLLARGYQFFYQIHRKLECKIYVTTILEDNYNAIKVLTSRKAGLPAYNDWGRIHTLMVKIGKNTWKAKNGLTYERAKIEDIPDILNLIKSESQKRQFVTSYSEDHLISKTGLLRGLDVGDIRLLRSNGKIVALTGIWNQNAFRRWHVVRYSSSFMFLKMIWNQYAKISRYPRFPDEAEIIDYRFLSFLTILNNNVDYLETLLFYIWKEFNLKRPNPLAMIALHEKDPLLKVFQKYPSYDLKSRLYVVNWPKDQQAVADIKRELIPTIEIASM
ncbi:MAG: hypothetical protein A2381_01500 [Bdellovibrionales bacterium RIFOXYB1_FULL_37_110]|nr:MAG: hypothetical protein A2417_02355 [Bdellovibrionales bacterium RIFOXYC1_FULL_37_79]OFZ58891.1 MAG: hypothetical protein A2381_01500 [Bdellovibrionales bacterium RIFOXYB1_FULL_37_110]OFZ64663.1 MAG: hypothetical protein A2577_13435 [Bdellovibrionales bacterium RIFOXYD1_FULL_36_51]